jgi:hypothetical protein
LFNKYTPIVQLGVQYNKNYALPFYINNSPNPILAHPYGLYELDLTNKTYIYSLKFDLYDPITKKLMVSESSPLIIDIVYEE